MLLFALLALIILIFVLSLHYTHHFKFHFKKCYQRRSMHTNASNEMSDIFQTQIDLIKRTNHTTRCCCELLPLDVEEYDFFPISFLFFVSFLILLCILIIIVQVLNYYFYHPNATMIDLLVGYSLKSYHNNSLLEMHQIKMDQINAVYIMDYILMYGILILSVWVSLFSYYRYYTTLMSTKKLKTVSTRKLFSKFRVFAFIFCVLFILQIHLWYWIFPVIIVLFCVFNFYCTFKFAAMLIKQYKLFIGLECIAMKADAQDMLRSSIFSKYVSLICCVLQSVNLSLFLIMYNVNIIYYLPILWAISCFILALNFVRNRTLFNQNITCIRSNEEIHIPKTENTQQILTKNEFIDIESENKNNSQHNISITSKNKILQTNKNSRSLCDLYTTKQVPIPSTINRTLSAPGDHTKLDLNTTSIESYDSYDSINLPKLHENKDSKSLDIYNDPRPPQLSFLQPAHSDPIASSNSNKPHENTRNNMTSTAKISTLRALSGLTILSSKSIYHNMDSIEDDNNSTPVTPVTPIPLQLIVTPLVENDDIVIHDTIKVPTLVATNEDINGEEDENAGFEILFDDDEDEKNNEMMIDMDIQMNDLRLINHGRSNSVPMNMDALFESFNVLAKCGFYSLKNVYELNKYQKRLSIIDKSATIQ